MNTVEYVAINILQFVLHFVMFTIFGTGLQVITWPLLFCFLGNVDTGKKLHVIPRGPKGSEKQPTGHTSHILCLAVSSDGKYLVSNFLNLLLKHTRYLVWEAAFSIFLNGFFNVLRLFACKQEGYVACQQSEKSFVSCNIIDHWKWLVLLFAVEF